MISASRTGQAVLPRPGEQVRWRHPRMAFALGRFSAYGPGPFGMVAVVDRGGQDALLVNTEFGEREIDAAWLGPALLVAFHAGDADCMPAPAEQGGQAGVSR